MPTERTESRLVDERWAAMAQASCRAGSGDCARMVLRADGVAVFFVGDVAGHDARASIFAAELDARVSDLAGWATPGALLMSLNAAVEAGWPADVFVSAVCVSFDPSTGRGTIASAGQLPPVVRGTSSCRALDVHIGPALGLAKEPCYLEREFTLGADDVLVSVTDGITDPFATGADPLGLAALDRILESTAVGPAGVCASLMNAARRHGTHDDATVLAIAPAFDNVIGPVSACALELAFAA